MRPSRDFGARTLLLFARVGVASLLLAASAWAENTTALPEGIAGSPEEAEAFDPLFDDFDPAPEIYDPIEGTNRVFFALNERIDRWFWSPLTRGYRYVAPEPLRRGIRRAFMNIETPVFLVNNLLQLRFREAGETLGAFVLNSTLGVGGLLEPGKEAGWERHPADFGQTLGVAGVGPGPYLVIPFLGPTTVRDGLGSVVDRAFQPLTYVLGIGTQILWGGGAGLATREEFADELDALQESSVDFYMVMRSVYIQSRSGEIEKRRRRWETAVGLGPPDEGEPADDPAAEPPAQSVSAPPTGI